MELKNKKIVIFWRNSGIMRKLFGLPEISF